MPILMNCTCGKQLRVPDDYAGRRVKCPACGETLTVAVKQASTPPPPPARAPAPSGVIRFACACGKLLQAREEYAGRMTRCPKCGEAMEIPGADAEADSEPRERIQAGRPAPKRPAALRDDDDDEVDRSRSRRQRPAAQRDDDDENFEEEVGRKKPRRRWRSKVPWLVAGAALLLLLAGGGVGAWLLFRGGTASDLVFVPGNAQGFVSVRVADVWKADATQKGVQQLKQQVPQMPDLVAESEKKFGLGPADVERLTVVFANVQAKEVYGIVLTSRPYDRAKVLSKLGPSPQEKKHESKFYHVGAVEGEPLAVHFVSDTILVAGPEPGVTRALAIQAGKKASGPLDDAIKLVSGKHHLVGALVAPPELQQTKAPPQVQPLLDVKTATLTMDLGNTMQLDVNLSFPSDAKAKEAKTSIDQGLQQVKNFMPLMKLQFARGPQAKEMGQALDQARKSLDSITVVQKGAAVALGMKAEMGSPAIGAGLLLPAVQKVREAAARLQSMNNLKQLALAMHNYHDRHGHFPPPVIYSKDGKRPLYSWRVELLPYVEEQQLYNEFHKDEPWDSPHNIQLLSRMPKVFVLPGRERPGQTVTCYQLFTGPGTPFPTDQMAPRMFNFTDGTSNTLLIVEGAREVSWSQPDDLKVPASGPIKHLLGGHLGDSFQAAMADGSVINVKKTVSDQTLRSAINPTDGKPLGPDWTAATK